MKIAVSISEGADTPRRGFPAWQVNRVTLQIASAVCGQGAGLILGHDWRSDGVMDAIYSFARNAQLTANPGQLDPASISVQNFLAWPQVTALTFQDREALGSTLAIENVPVPLQLAATAAAVREEGEASPRYRYLRARALTEARRVMSVKMDARLCIGGQTSNYEGRYPGIIEEALLAVTSGKPLFLSSLMGGAAALLVKAIRGRRMPKDFCRGTSVSTLYDHPPIAETDPGCSEDRSFSPSGVWQTFAEFGVNGLAESCGLSTDEVNTLLDTQVVDSLIHLTLKGLGAISRR